MERYMNPALGGGSLFDLGFTLIQFATLVSPATLPDQMIAQGLYSASGVDVEASFSLQVLHTYTYIPHPTRLAVFDTRLVRQFNHCLSANQACEEPYSVSVTVSYGPSLSLGRSGRRLPTRTTPTHCPPPVPSLARDCEAPVSTDNRPPSGTPSPV